MPSGQAILKELSSTLRHLHRALIEAESTNFPDATGPYDRLMLVVEHPEFRWLHALSELIVEIDELADDEAAGGQAATPCKEVIERLLGPAPAVREDFRTRYLDLMQSAPDVAIASGAVRRVLARL
ncbi:hypothetical protein [Undibacterium terreum]|uniref:Uncharacterized protein n=1 Tax=Undibacterium terreum TaxID=1224302 RepID=A0A916U7Y3_9BURK|nr:hypothetical protein [Undibacterium terreum]GGC62782.1 hypothetical protein GCM10011396_07200 [Undibacterium terreum]